MEILAKGKHKIFFKCWSSHSGVDEGPSLMGCTISVANTRVLPKVMSNFFLHANWEQQTKESAVVD